MNIATETPNEPAIKKTRRGKRSGKGMTLAMVAINGFLITCVSFLIIHFYVSVTLTEEKKSTATLLQKSIADKEQNLNVLLDSLGIILSNIDYSSPNVEISSQIREKIMMFSTKSVGISDLYYLDISGNTPRVMRVYHDDSMHSKTQEKNVFATLQRLKLSRKVQGNFQLLVPDTGGATTQENNTKDIVSRDLCILKQVVKDNQAVGYYVLVVPANDIAKIWELTQLDNLNGATVTDKSTNQAFYRWMSRDNQRAGEDITMHVVFGNSDLDIKANFIHSPQSELLRGVPWIIFALGGGITIVAFLYIQNSHRASESLKILNLDLENKTIALSEEVGERERLNQSLRRAERENKAIINSISDTIFEISLSGEILFLNDSWQRMTAFQIEDSLGKNLFDMLPLAEQEDQKKSVSQMVKGLKQAYRVLTAIKTANGNYRAVDLSMSMIRMDENRNMRVVGSFSDMEERQKAEWALTEAEKKYHSIWENAASGIYQMNLEGKILSANPALAKIFGYESADVMISDIKNAHTHLYVLPQERVKMLKGIDADHPIEMCEFQAICRNGTRIWIQETIRNVLDEHGMHLYFEGSVEEISKRKEAEIQLQEAKRTSDMANRAKSEFLANMSHELRTPLNSIIGFSEIIRNQVFGPIEPSSYWEYARDIHESGKHLLSIINQILDISRIDAGERELKESLIDMKKLVKNVVDLNMPKIKEAQLELSDINYDPMPHIVGEDLAIRQIITNILSNAIKFTPAGGRISIASEMDEVGDFRLAFTDTGVGLDENEITRVVSRFGVTDGRLSRGTSGIGLGLSLVKSLMTLHGGDIEIFSQKGIGTTVTLTFPKARVQSVV